MYAIGILPLILKLKEECRLTKQVWFADDASAAATSTCCHLRRTTASFVRIVRLWNSLPFIDLSNSFRTIKWYLCSYFWNHFIQYFDSIMSALSTLSVLVTHVISFVHIKLCPVHLKLNFAFMYITSYMSILVCV